MKETPIANRPSCPRSTPWGRADHIKQVIPGMWWVSTPSHGGFYLSPERLLQMPAWAIATPRWAGLDDGPNGGPWFEEDCEWCIPVLVFWDEYQVSEKAENQPDTYTNAVDTLKNWHPARYEVWAGVKLEPGESFINDERLLEEATKDKWVAIANVGDWHAKVPAGFIGSTATLGGRRGDGRFSPVCRYFLVPDSDYRNDFVIGKAHCLVIDLARHEEVGAL
jgi:hypothetical protein